MSVSLELENTENVHEGERDAGEIAANDGGGEEHPIQEQPPTTSTAGRGNRSQQLPSQLLTSATTGAKETQPARTDPIKALPPRQRRLDRLPVGNMPEIHIIGQVSGGFGLMSDSAEGACCRFKIDHGAAWQHLSGELVGQTQIAYSNVDDPDYVTFNHPIDAHFAEAGLQGWGAPRIAFQSFRLDTYGRKLLVGYGFGHLPITTGYHRLEICLWRPCGSPEQEIDAFLLGKTPALISQEPIYESAWKERCRLVTIPAGKIYVEIFVVNRHLRSHGLDDPSN